MSAKMTSRTRPRRNRLGRREERVRSIPFIWKCGVVTAKLYLIQRKKPRCSTERSDAGNIIIQDTRGIFCKLNVMPLVVPFRRSALPICRAADANEDHEPIKTRETERHRREREREGEEKRAALRASEGTLKRGQEIKREH